MKKVVIISAAVGVISVVLMVGLIMGKLSNTNLAETDGPKLKPKVENKTEGEIEQVNKSDYVAAKMPDFKGDNESEVNEFTKNHDMKYEVGEIVSTPLYHLKNLVATQSIDPGENISKDDILKISLYGFDGHYDPTKEEDPCHDENGNLIKSDKPEENISLSKSYYQTKIYEAQCMDSAMESYSASDSILNEMWGELKNIVTPGEFEILRAGQRNWIEDKESASDIEIKSRMTIERCNYLLNTYYK